MKKLFSLFLLACFQAHVLVCFQAHALNVVIDPGHGGKDKGAVKKGTNESDVALQVSLRIHELLKNDQRFRVFMTRDKDVFLSLKRRAELAHKFKADVFLSIHANSSPDPRARGAEFYFENQLPPDEEALYMANKENEIEEDQSHEEVLDPLSPISHLNINSPKSPEVAAILLDMLHSQKISSSSLLTVLFRENWQGNRRSKQTSIRQAPFYVVSRLLIPSVLIELGFLTHPQEGRSLTQVSYQKKIARSIYDGLVQFKETIDKPSEKNLNQLHAKRPKTLE